MVSKRNKIAATVILYHPPVNVWENIESYVNQVDFLYIISNSVLEPFFLENNLLTSTKVKLINNNRNLGIGNALNKAAVCAMNDGYHFLLTMDQDSSLSEKFIEKMVEKFSLDNRIGIISPFIVHRLNPKQSSSNDIIDLMVAMTSGSLLKLDLFREVGQFEEKLFIDYIDHEYSLRMISKGFLVKQLNTVSITHNLGDVAEKKILGFKVYPTNHSAQRLYYRTRNRLFVYSKYWVQFPNYVLKDFLSFLKEITKILLFESYKMNKIQMILKGINHYLQSKFGELKN